MDVKDFKKIVTAANAKNWFNEVEIDVEVADLQENLQFKGLNSLYTFIRKQAAEFKELNLKPGSNLESSSIQFYEVLATQLVAFVERYSSVEEIDVIQGNWNSLYQTYIASKKDVFTAGSTETKILIDLEHRNLSQASSTFQYLIGRGFSSYDNDSFTGYLIGYEIRNREFRKANQFIKTDNGVISKVQAKFTESLGEAETQLADHLHKTNENFLESWQKIEQTRLDMEGQFTSWFTETTANADSLDEVRKNKIDDLEQTYQEKLRLSAPAQHWQDASNSHKKKGDLYLGLLIALVLIAGISLWVILVNAPANIYSSWFNEDKSAAVRWTIVYITMIGLMAFAIKQMTKLMFSSYHLARDCQERKLLTSFYLSLIKEASVDKEQQNLIISSLFSRAETGLLKDDGTPAMPTDALKSLLGK